MNSSTDANNSDCEFDRNLNTLRNIALFSEMGIEPLKALAYVCKTMHYRAGDQLFEQGMPDTQAYCLTSGTLEVVYNEDDHHNVLQQLEPGAFVGGLSLIARTKRLFTLRAAGPATCMILPQRHFQSILLKNPDVAGAFFKALYSAMYRWEEEFLSRPSWREWSRSNAYFGVTLL